MASALIEPADKGHRDISARQPTFASPATE
jgi:hypothetical protein